MDERERLIELIAAGGYHRDWATMAADRILADGWFRPLCKAGDTVYAVLFDTYPIRKWYISAEKVTEAGVRGCWTSGYNPPKDDMGNWWNWRDFGREIFTDKGEALAAAKKYMKEGHIYQKTENEDAE